MDYAANIQILNRGQKLQALIHRNISDVGLPSPIQEGMGNQRGSLSQRAGKNFVTSPWFMAVLGGVHILSITANLARSTQ